MQQDQTYYYDVLLQSFTTLWSGFIGFIPNLIAAVIIFLFGWIFASALRQVVERLLKMAQFEKLLARLGWEEFLKRAEVRFDASRFVGELVRWFVVLAFLLAAADILNLDQLTEFLKRILLYIPNIIVAALVLLIGGLVGDFLDRAVIASVKAAGFGYGKMLGATAKWAIFVFALLVALDQLQIGRNIINTLFTGFVAMIAIAGGLAFGMGGRDVAADLLSRIRDRLTERS